MKFTDIIKKNYHIYIFWILIFILLVLIGYNSSDRWFDKDEIEAMHTGWKVLQGERIYTDFFQQHNPLFYYLLAVIIKISGENKNCVINLRYTVYSLLLLIFFINYLIGKKIFNKETAVISMLLLATANIFITPAIEVRPDVPQALFGLICVFFLMVYYDNKKLKYLILSSLMFGVSFLFLQKAAFLLILIGCLLFYSFFRRELNFKFLAIYFSIILSILAAFLIYLYLNNSLSQYITYGYILNMKILIHFSPAGYIKMTCEYNALLWFFYVIGILFFMKTPNQKRMAFLSLGLFFSVFLVRAPWQQYYMMAVPLVAVISAHALQSLFIKNKNMILVVVLLSVIFPGRFLVYNINENINKNQLRKIKYVLDITNPDDYVYDGDVQFNVFRKDIDFFWKDCHPYNDALATYREMTGYDYDIYNSIEKYNPKVISSYYIDDMNDTRIKGYYVPSNKYEDIYIRQPPFYKSINRAKGNEFFIEKKGEYILSTEVGLMNRPFYKSREIGDRKGIDTEDFSIIPDLWEFNVCNCTYTFDKNQDIFTVSANFKAKSAENQFVQMRRKNLLVDLKEYPFLILDYKLDDPSVQYIEIVAGVDINNDRIEDFYIKGIDAMPQSEQWCQFSYNLLSAAMGISPYYKDYDLVFLELYPHKKPGQGFEKGEEKKYTFYIKNLFLCNMELFYKIKGNDLTLQYADGVDLKIVFKINGEHIPFEKVKEFEIIDNKNSVVWKRVYLEPGKYVIELENKDLKYNWFFVNKL